MHADGAVRAIVEQQHNAFATVLGGGGQLLPVHQKVAVASDGEGHPPRQQGRRNAGRHAIAHGAIGGCELGFEALGQAAVAVKTVQPAGEVARAVGEHGVSRQVALQGVHDGGHVECAGQLHAAVGRVDVGQVVGVAGLGPVAPGHLGRRGQHL